MTYGSQRSRPPGNVLRRGTTFMARWTVKDLDGIRRQRSRSGFPTETAAWSHLRRIEADRLAAERTARDLVYARAAKRAMADFVTEAELTIDVGDGPDLIEELFGLPHHLRSILQPHLDTRDPAATAILDGFSAVCRSLARLAHDSLAAREVATIAVQTFEERVGAALDGIAAERSTGFLTDPRGFFVYCLWGDHPTCPLYVGQSANVLNRLGAHFGDREKVLAIRRVSLIRCASVVLMLATERKLIRRYQPPWNAMGILRETV